MSTRFSMVVAVHLFLLKGEKILLARRYHTGWGDGQFSVPAGHVEQNETALQAMIREAKEEANIQVSEEDLSLVHTMHRQEGSETRIDFFFACKKWTGEPMINEPNKCDEMAWFTLENLPKNTLPYIRQAIESFLQNRLYSERGFSVKS